jgi:hypothetical protein
VSTAMMMVMMMSITLITVGSFMYTPSNTGQEHPNHLHHHPDPNHTNTHLIPLPPPSPPPPSIPLSLDTIPTSTTPITSTIHSLMMGSHLTILHPHPPPPPPHHHRHRISRHLPHVAYKDCQSPSLLLVIQLGNIPVVYVNYSLLISSSRHTTYYKLNKPIINLKNIRSAPNVDSSSHHPLYSNSTFTVSF